MKREGNDHAAFLVGGMDKVGDEKYQSALRPQNRTRLEIIAMAESCHLSHGWKKSFWVGILKELEIEIAQMESSLR